MTQLDLLKQCYKEFKTLNLETLRAVYDDNIVFIDPIKKVEGIGAMISYFESSRSNVEYCNFHFNEHFEDGDNIFLAWDMHFAHQSLNNGAKMSVSGASHLRLKDNKVIYHRDYYDLGEMLYEHIAVVGAVVRWIKGRL